MKREVSCGAVVFRRGTDELQYVIIRGEKGFYGFPKGHMEAGETEQETALREIWEETGLHVHLIDGFRTEDERSLIREGKPDTMKKIVYFLADYENQDLCPQDDEIQSVSLMTFEQAMDHFQLERNKRILMEAVDFLSNENTALKDEAKIL